MSKRGSYRIVFDFLGTKYKFLNFFSGNADNSFYFHIYRKLGQPARVSPVITRPGERTPIRFEEFIPIDFDLNKLTFHPSGDIHSTDMKGRKYKESVRGQPFEAIETHYDLLVVAACKPDEMVLFTSPKNSTDIVLILPADISPFSICFTVFRVGAVLPASDPGPLLDRYLVFQEEGRTFGLVMSMRPVRPGPGLNRATWPPFTFWLKRIAP